ncbi:MAG: DUF4416 family protein [Planctomycetota bacterium]
MGSVSKPVPVKYFVGMLAARPEWLDLGRSLLADSFGRLDLASETWPFDETRYYEPQMGHPLLRSFVTAHGTGDPGKLADYKLITNDLECRAAAQVSEVQRPLNLDVGYLGLSQVLLASTKPASHRAYIGKEIYAEVTLRYVRGTFEALPWTYPDYRRPEYHEFFRLVRKGYKAELQADAHGPG